MKKIVFIFLSMLFAQALSAQSKTETNDFYDNDSTYNLEIPKLEITGEVANAVTVDLSKLPLRSEIVKEATLNENGDTAFVGAYRYDGYSLYDILNNIILKKKNEAEFNSIIDLYVEVENAKGDKVVFSWGELYYPVNRYKIFFATQVARIVPSKTKDLWPLPTENKLIVATDLITVRNISNPTKITVKSYSASIPVNRDLQDKYAKEITITKNEKQVDKISKYPDELKKEDYSTVFYGRGRGIHGISDFKGAPLKNVLAKYVQLNKNNIQKGLVVVVGKDGYRCVFTYSELFNRNDFAETLLLNRSDDKENGAFSIFAASDYFSDRAIKMISEIRIVE
ncbi:MAG TPA: hypothetical protein PKK00_09320 [Bacteroidales bacterium]|nr:hypothetical protein [Bacteroidales bacterium]HPS17483.1 hypothetical protein [Bacteroidales bacterium]